MQSPKPNSMTPANRYKSLLIMISALLTLESILFGLYYFSQVTDIKTIKQERINEFPTASTDNKLQQGWSYKSSGECGVTFAVPPKSEPYLDKNGKYWDIQRGNVDPEMLSLLRLKNDEIKQVGAMYSDLDEKNRLLPDSIVISCIQNNGRYDGTSNLLSELFSSFAEHDAKLINLGIPPMNYHVESYETVTRWGDRSVVDIVVSNKSNVKVYSMLVTPDYIYEIFMINTTKSQTDTAQKIFDSLEFTNLNK